MNQEKVRTVRMHPLGDAAVVVVLGDDISVDTNARVRQFAEYVEHHPFTGMIEQVPAFQSVTVYYEPLAVLEAYGDQAAHEGQSPYVLAKSRLEGLLDQLGEAPPEAPRTVTIPVCYGGEFGPDLETVARVNHLTTEEVVAIHSGAEYLVYMLGFAPGFAYLGGMSGRIRTPRRETPRLAIPAGTVGIAGDQTGVYPIETPGGWQLIGRTPTQLFLPGEQPPALLKAGDLVRFRPIARAEYDAWKEQSP
ncbi:5-oxoprolinase subunit PxpB [Paenibacillus sp. IB182496]|uniref:5-oxoprolinase subunit PxpB n=1 Tax=Paenibacillus sabuli TaxID=2772509 RepID=A0A927GPY6_9BACL|nr:5-oxoprolinase subunit PxpB [Paenibacillus sabuli]MBD2843721.1 5-oxoprolinase subunit PxpB [Paenibacillus sabuli]